MTTALPQRIAAVVLLAALLVLAALGVASASASDGAATASDDEVEIGTAVYYEKAEDGTVTMVVRD
ncbi:MAG: hypothetical protein ACLGIR_08460 [Actinomycetes bacterium]|jgi:ABC-type glycerol-3-phosphate transport system substrate-binding protein